MFRNTIFFLLMYFFCFAPFHKLKAQQSKKVDEVRDYISLTRSFLGRNNQKAQEYAMKALELARAAGVDSLKGKAHRFSGIASYYFSDFNQALVHYDSAKFYFTKLNDSLELARIYNNKGALFTQLNLFHNAIGEYLKAKEIYTNMSNTRGTIIINNNIGSLYQMLGQYNKALSYYDHALKIAEANNLTEELLNAMGNVATIYELTNNWAEAEKTYRLALSKAQFLGSESIKASLKTNFGSFWLLLKQPDSALQYLNSARTHYRDLSLNLSKFYLSFARAYKLKHQKDKAIEYYRLALENVGKGSDAVLRSNILRELARLIAERGEYNNAYSLLEDFANEQQLVRQENDSLKNLNLQLNFTVNRLEASRDSLEMTVDQLVAKQTQLENTNRKLLIFFIASIITLFFAAFLIVKLRRKDRRNTKQLKTYDLKVNQLTTEIEATHKLKEELSQIHKLLSMLLEVVPFPLAIKDANGNWLMANDAMCHKMGIKSGKLNQQNQAEATALSIRSAEFFRMLEVAEELAWMKKNVSSGPESLSDPYGEDLGEFMVTRVPVFSKTGERQNMIIFIMPSDSKTTNNVQQQLYEALSILSHEIRTPLNAVLGFSDMLADESIGTNKRRQYARIVQRNANLLLKLTDELLLFTSLESGFSAFANSPFDLRELFTGLHTRLVNKALELGKNQIEIILNIPNAPCVIKGDELRWMQLFDHLLDNALKYTQKGMVQFGFVIDTDGDKPMVNAFVEDTGPGIPTQMQQKIFEPFARLEVSKTTVSGAGLGLSIVSRLANLMNIRLKMSSDQDKGTRFDLYYEIKDDNSQTSDTNTNQNQAKKLAGKKVLIVEDNPSSYELLKIILEGAEAQVLHATTGEEAVELCRTNHEINLVLMDIHLPKMDGLEATRQIKAIRPQLLIIAHTALALSSEKDACFEAGCDGYFSKPIKPRLLLLTLEQLFQQ